MSERPDTGPTGAVSLLDALSFEGRTAIVTGGSRGIGMATARQLAALGANVVLTARTDEAARIAADEIGGGVVGIGAHASSEESARACVAETIDRFGSVDVLVNNAATNPAAGPVIAQDLARFTKTVEVNLWAPLLWSSLVAKSWMTEHGGSIVNTASIGGLEVMSSIGVYNATKAALIHLTRQLAFELAPRIRVNAVAPGIVRTKLSRALWEDAEAGADPGIPLGRFGEPSDISNVIAFLASDASEWMTGSVVVVDGGQHIADHRASLGASIDHHDRTEGPTDA